MNTPTPINFNIPKLQRLKDAYDRARATGREQFNFEGNTYVAGYAKYLIEHLENQFGIKRETPINEHAN